MHRHSHRFPVDPRRHCAVWDEIQLSSTGRNLCRETDMDELQYNQLMALEAFRMMLFDF